MTSRMLAGLMCILSTACGGSASETPPPLEPLPRRGRPAHVPPGAASGEASPLLPRLDEEAPPAPATWGTEPGPAASAEEDPWMLK